MRSPSNAPWTAITCDSPWPNATKPFAGLRARATRCGRSRNISAPQHALLCAAAQPTAPLGYAQAIGKLPVVLIQAIAETPFDLHDWRQVVYSRMPVDSDELEIAKHVRQVLNSPR